MKADNLKNQKLTLDNLRNVTTKLISTEQR